MRHIHIAVLMSAALLSVANAAGREDAPRSPHKAQFERAYRLKEQKLDAQALEAFNAILRKEPRNHAALTEAGYLHASLKQYGPAAERLGAASKQDPDNMRLRMDLAYVQQARKRRAEANEQFRIVASRPGEFQEAARRQIGFHNFEAGRFAEAAADFEAVLAARPDDHLAALQLGYAYERLKKQERAREAFSAALGSTDARIHDAAQSALQASGGAPMPAPASSL